ncbi:MAG TPA: hypothetical protein VMT10_07360 [Solirubrobacteraceae bacterium]|nr:hypothetical protein [Solirubrobacteraceae bacterium]
MLTIALEAAEALVPLTLAGLFFARSARHERRRIAAEEVRVALAAPPAAPSREHVLDRLHEARMRRRALRLIARHHAGQVR